MQSLQRFFWTFAGLLACSATGRTQPASTVLPQGGNVTQGQATLQQGGTATAPVLNVQQGSQRAVIQWDSFNLGSAGTVNFNQPNAQAATLNRVTDMNPSQILGRINAPGQVTLINPAGVYFGASAVLDVGALTASTLQQSDADFMAGKAVFNRGGATGSVANAGSIHAQDYIALLAPEVRNTGALTVAQAGSVVLAGGEAVQLNFDAMSRLASLTVTPSQIATLVENRSAVVAPGGLIILSATALRGLQAAVVNSGTLDASSLTAKGGRILLEGDTVSLAATSRVEAKGLAGVSDGGAVDIKAQTLQLGGVVDVSGNNGGSIAVQASSSTQITGQLLARGDQGVGGSLVLAAGQLLADAGSRVDVSGNTRGGLIQVATSPVSGAAAAGIPPSIEVRGELMANATHAESGQGGTIDIGSSGGNIRLHNASLQAEGSLRGGDIRVAAMPATAVSPLVDPANPANDPLAPTREPLKVALTGSTTLSTRSRRGDGGKIALTGDDVLLADGNRLDATGATAGGTVRVGGGWQGGEGLYQATTVTMAEAAVIDASATKQGNGGSVVLWSDLGRADGLTTAAGSILARGAGAGGNGGKVETSGHQVDSAGARVNAGADAGQGGTGGLWLIDPSDTTITQAVANGYAATLSTGTSVLNDVTGSITWNSGVTLTTTAGGAGSRAALTLRSANNAGLSPITLTNASISASGGALDLVLWTSYNTEGFEGRVSITGSTITTNGGNVWIGGGNAAGSLWNGLTVGRDSANTYTKDAQGVRIATSAISTGAGSIQIKGQSFVTGSTDGTLNFGVWIQGGTTLATTTGGIDIQGDVRGTFANGVGTLIDIQPAYAGNVTLSSTSGNIAITGTGGDQAGTGTGWRVATMLRSENAGNTIAVRSASGAITLNGAATFNAGTDISGVQLQAASTGKIQVVSQTGAISLIGSSTRENVGQYLNGLRLTAPDIADSIRIGYDGSNAYSGNILLQSNSILQRNENAGVGSLAVQTSGNLTIQSAGNAFTYLRAGNAGTLTFDNDWNFGSTLSGITIGKTTNTLDLTLSNALSVAGGINLYAGQIALNAALTSTGTGDINIVSNANSNAAIVSGGGGTISKTGGGNSTLTVRSNSRVNLTGAITNTSTSGVLNVVLWSDYGNATTYGVSGVPAVTTRGGHLWVGGSNSANGSTTWNGLTVGDGPAAGGTGGNANTIDLNGILNTANGAAGGDVYIWGGSSNNGGVSLNGNPGFTGISAGSGNITLRGGTFAWSNPLNITSTGAFTLWSGSGTIGTDTGSFGQATDLNFFRFNAAPSAFTWGGAGNTQNVTFSPTYNATLTVAGPITVYGGNIALNGNLTTTAPGAGILAKASVNITTSASSQFQTNNGDLVLWADSDANGTGAIAIGDNNTLNTANGATASGLTGGGRIVLAGGADGNADGLPDGYAASGTLSGVSLGSSTANYTQMYSGGGDVAIRGRSTSASGASVSNKVGVYQWGRWLVDAGKGAITIDGSSSNYYGINFVEPASNLTSTAKHLQLISDKASGTAINITGTSGGSHGVVFNYLNPKEILATGGGDIVVTGTGAGSGYGIFLQNQDILASGGNITLNGGTRGIYVTQYGTRLGSRAGSAVTSASGNITLTGDVLQLDALTGGFTNTLATSGTVTLQPFGNNFSAALNTAPLTLASSVSGLRLGKDIGTTAHTDTITVGSALSIAGPYSLYGGTLNINGALTTSGATAGDSLFKSSGDILVNAGFSRTGGADSTLTLLAGRDIVFTGAGVSASGGKLNLVLVSDWDSVNGGAVYLNGSGTAITLAANGGHVWIGGNGYGTAFGSSTWNALTVGTGLANASPTTTVFEGVQLNRTTVNTAGGNLYIAGHNARYNNAEDRFGVLVKNGSSINTGAGSIDIRGTLQAQAGALTTYPNLFGVDINASSLSSTSGAITVTGGERATDGSSNASGMGVRLYNASVSATSGAIAITGTTGTDNGGGGSRDGLQLFAEGDNARTTVSTTSGAITLTGTSNVTNQANSSGISIKTAKSANTDANNPAVKVVSQTGSIVLTGDNPNNSATGSSGIGFSGASYGRFYIGQDETGTSSSSVTLAGRSVTEVNMASGNLRLLGSGALTIQPLGNSFVRGTATGATNDFNSNWSFGSGHSAITLGKDVAAAKTDTITVSNALTAAGPVSLYAGNLNLNANLSSTASGAALLAKASGNIVLAANTLLTTNLGNLTLWSDSDASGQGYIAMDQGVRMNTINGATSGTGGGKLTLAGGLDTDADGRPDGYASAASTDTGVIGPAHNGTSVYSHTPSGVQIGFYEKTATYINDFRFYTGGGDVVIRGKAANGSPGVSWYGGQSGATQLVDAGAGTIVLEGQSTAGHGIELGYFGGTSSPSFLSASNAATAISVTAASTGTGNGYQGGANFIASGTGGIAINGTAKDSATGVTTGGLGVYAASGAITITGTVTGTGAGTGINLGGGLGKGGGLAASSSNIVLNADRINFQSAETIDTTGTLTVQPVSTSFASTLSWPLSNLTLGSTLSGLTLGKAGNTADITVTAATSVAGPIRIYGGNINLNANLSSTLAGAGISALASGSITTNNAITLTTNGGALLLAADTDGAGGGLINANGNFTANTSGGAITLGGGLDGTGYALGFGTGTTNATGIRFRGTSTFNSGGGNISIKGKSHTSGGNGSNAAAGLWFDGSSSINSGTGTVYLEGVSQAATTSDYALGMMFGFSGGATTTSITSANTTAGAIRLVGNAATAGNAAFNSGFRFYSNGTSITATGAGGGITLEGTRNTAGNANDFSFADGGGVGTTSSILALSGPILLSGKTAGGQIFMGAMTLGSKAATAVTSSTSNVTITADGLSNTLAGSAVNTSGTLTVQPLSTSFTSALSWPINNLAVAPTLGGLTLGKAGNTADITLASALTVNGPVALYGGNLALNAGLTASTVTLQGSGTVTDGPSGFVSVANLLLLGGNVLLDSASTSVGTLVASGVGNLDVHNGGALTIGTVGATGGIDASGTVAVSTQSGDLTLAAAVRTSDTSTSAIVLNAGRAAAAGTAAGGNLVVNGSPAMTTGAGGRATLYSGSIAGSTGLGTLVGVGRSRYHSDESASNFSTALGSGLYAIYREQPSVALSWNNQSVVYGTALPAFGYTVTSGALHNGDTPTAALSGGVVSGAGHLAVSATPYAVNGSGALAALGYSVAQTTGQVTVTPRLLAASYNGATRAYDGSTAATVSASSDDRLVGDVLSVSGSGSFADANAGTGKAIAISGGSLSGADAGNYALASGGSATGDITPRTVSASGAVVANKVYDGTTDATLLQAGQVGTGVGSETLVLSATGAAFATAGAGTGKTVTVNGYALANGANGGLASNYRLASTSATTTADIAKAVLTVVANDDAKFITKTDAAGYNGVAYTGFVNGETASVLGGSASVVRSNAGEGAQVYNGVLVVDTAGLSAANYSFQTRNGNFTIVPSNQLLVRVANTVGTYGAATVHSVTSAQYFDGVTVVTLAGVTDHGGNRFTVSDGVGGTATLTVAPTAAPVSSGGWTGVGAWQLAGTQVSTQNAANFSNTVTVVGSETVAARGLSVNTAGGVAKVYDGTTAMPSVTLQLAGAANGDVLGVSAQGSFADRNAGSNIAYTVNGIALSGADAANYYVTGGTSFSGSNGSITPRTLHVGYTGVDKVYDGNTAASVTSSDDRIAGDVLSVSALAAFADKNVGSGKLVTVSGAALAGGDAGNYTLASTTDSTTADITRLGSVVWTGGATGNWFDPANWAGGAVPDLANVANVLIPAGVVVSFDTTGVVVPAQTGPVLIDSLGGAGGAGGGLVQNNGVLNVGGGGILLAGLTQHGGSLTSEGAIVVNDFAQTGGSTSTLGNLTVNGNFAQGTGGTVTVGGNANITDTSGGATIGNLHTGGDLAITSTDGGITQQAGTVIVVNGSTTVNAGNSDITLDGPNNDFEGPFNAGGGNVTVADLNGLMLGTVSVTGNLNLTSHGALDLGTSVVGGRLEALSHDGNITQTGALSVGGNAILTAGSGDIVLTASANRFGGTLTATGGRIEVIGAGLGGGAGPDQGAGQTQSSLVFATLVPVFNSSTSLVSTQAAAGSELQMPASLPVSGFPGSAKPGSAPDGDRPTQSFGGAVIMTPIRNLSDNTAGLVQVQVSSTALRTGSFRVVLPEQIVRLLRSRGGEVTAVQADGQPLPTWLRFDPQDLVFTARSVPVSALPLTVLLRLGSYRVEIEITELMEQV